MLSISLEDLDNNIVFILKQKDNMDSVIFPLISKVKFKDFKEISCLKAL